MSRVRLIARGFGDGAKIFEEEMEIDGADIPDSIRKIADTHVSALMAYRVHMIELEFPDEPENERFFRFGSDPRGMVMPIEVLL